MPMDHLRLQLARMASWALLVSAWLVLGALGHRHLPLWAGGMLPLALWLACMAGCMRLALMALPKLRLSLAIAVPGWVCAAALWWVPQGGGGLAVLVASVAWAPLLVAASSTIRQLRPRERGALPLWPVTLGLLLGGVASHELVLGAGSAHASAALVMSAAVLLLVLRCVFASRSVAGPSSACRQGLFDCALPLPALPDAPGGLTATNVGTRPWTQNEFLSIHAARWAMLPMMATLPTMTAWCAASASVTTAPSVLLAMHLAAMVVPAWVMRALPRLKWQPRTAPTTVALLIAGGVVLLSGPSLRGLMLATLLHTAAWSVAWELGLRQRDGPQRMPLRAVPLFAFAAPLCLLLLGCTTAAWGPQALMWVHLMLALVGLLSCWPWLAGKLQLSPAQ
jgi:hypothetical protein